MRNYYKDNRNILIHSCEDGDIESVYYHTSWPDGVFIIMSDKVEDDTIYLTLAEIEKIYMKMKEINTRSEE